MTVTREQVLAYRWRTQQLDGATGADVRPTDVAILDLGVQDGANDAARLALLNRGVSVADAIAAMAGFTDELALAWTVRGAPHLYRRAQLADVATATSPYSEADAAKRVVSAAASLRQAGVYVLDALAVVGRQQRDTVTTPMSKGDLSGALHATLPAEYQTSCRPCGCVHSFEMPFRLAALYAGLELEPGTGPPVVRRVPNWPAKRPIGPAPDPLAAPAQLQPVRAYLHFCGPATPKDVATYLETHVSEVKAVWPEDVVPVDRAGTRAWILADDERAVDAAGQPDPAHVKLLNGFDLFLAAKDRQLLVPDKAQAKELWPVLGRPGVIVAGGEILGTWRPKSGRTGLTVRTSLWVPLGKATLRAIERQAEVLALSRGQQLAGVVSA